MSYFYSLKGKNQCVIKIDMLKVLGISKIFIIYKTLNFYKYISLNATKYDTLYEKYLKNGSTPTNTHTYIEQRTNEIVFLYYLSFENSRSKNKNLLKSN